MVRLLNNTQIEELLTMKDCIDVLEQAYLDLADNKAVNVRRVDVYVPTAEKETYYVYKTMSGIVPRYDVVALRINSDIYHWPLVEGIPRKEIVPAASGKRYVRFVLLFSCTTGEPLAIFPDGYMQKMRVGATNGLGIKYIAREDSEVIGLLGTGWQASAQLEAACVARKVKEVRVFSPTKSNREDFARRMAEKAGVEIVPVDKPELCFEGCDIVITATNSMSPVYDAEWAEKGMHLTSLKRQEVDERVFDYCSMIVLNSRSHIRPIDHVIGNRDDIPELSLSRGQWFDIEEKMPKKTVDLADVVAGKVQVRKSPDDITYFMNNLGLGMQFAAVGSVILRKAIEHNVGQDIPVDWFLQDAHS